MCAVPAVPGMGRGHEGNGRRGRWRLRACGGRLNRTGEVTVEPDGGKMMGKDGKPWAVAREAGEMGG